MATTQNTYTGDGSTVSYSFTFPYLEETDIKVSLNGVVTTAYSLSNATTVTFSTAPASGVAIRIYRDTNNDALAATFFAGSAIRAQDLNDDFLQNAYVTQEVKNRYLDRQAGGSVTGDVTITGDVTLTGAVGINGTLDMNANRIIDVANPTSDQDAATKFYIDTRLGNISIPGHTRWRATATASQTTFSGTGAYGGTLAYTATREQVYLNGALQQRGVDYTADNGTSIVFSVALTAGDIVDIVCVNNLNASTVADAANINYGSQFTGQTTRTVAAKLADVVSVKDFGAVGDGTTDDTSAIQAAINAVSGGGVVTFPKGTYKVGSSLTVSNSNVHLDLGSATVLADSFTGWDSSSGTNFSGNRNRGLIRFTGNLVLTTDCSDASLSATALSLNLNSTTNVQVGDLLYLESDEAWYGTATKQETHRVIKVDSLTVYLDRPLYHSYNISGNTTSVNIIRPLLNCSVSGGVIEGEGMVDGTLLNGFGPCGVEAKGVTGFKIYDTEIKYFQNKALAFDWAVQSSATNLFIVGHEDSYAITIPTEDTGYSSFYGIFAGQSYGINLDGIKGRRVRHLTDGSNTHKSTINNCHATYTWKSTYRTHAGCNDFVYNGCTSAAQHYGMQWEGFDLTVSNCNLTATDGGGGMYGLTDAAGNTSDPQRTIRLLNNTIQGGVRAVYLRANVKGLIQGNTFINNGTGTSGLIQLDSPSFDQLTIKDNLFEDSVGTRGIQIISTSGTDGDHIAIIGNTFNYTGTAAAVSIQSNQAGNKQLDVVVSNNTLPSSVTNAAEYSARTGGLYRVVDNFSGSTILNRELPEMKVGTWTASMTGTTGDPTGGVVTNANCRYIRIGSMVWVNGSLSGDLSGATGKLKVSGLPYKSYGTNGRTIFAVNIGKADFDALEYDIVGRIDNNSTNLQFFYNKDATNVSEVDVPATTSVYLNFAIVYGTADPF